MNLFRKDVLNHRESRTWKQSLKLNTVLNIALKRTWVIRFWLFMRCYGCHRVKICHFSHGDMLRCDTWRGCEGRAHAIGDDCADGEEIWKLDLRRQVLAKEEIIFGAYAEYTFNVANRKPVQVRTPTEWILFTVATSLILLLGQVSKLWKPFQRAYGWLTIAHALRCSTEQIVH